MQNTIRYNLTENSCLAYNQGKKAIPTASYDKSPYDKETFTGISIYSLLFSTTQREINFCQFEQLVM